MTHIAGGQWYVVQTKPCAENKALVNLERQGFKTYFPRYLKRRRHARRVDVVPAPMFPRYLFVMIDRATQGWHSIESTFGVVRLVRNGLEPAAVPVGIVEQLQTNADARGFMPIDLRPRFAPGDRVRVLDGAFASCVGLFDRPNDSERVAVLLELLGRKVRVILDQDSVVSA